MTSSIDETVGLYFSYGVTQHNLKEDSLLWETARSLKAQLSALMASPQVFEVIRQAADALNLLRLVFDEEIE